MIDLAIVARPTEAPYDTDAERWDAVLQRDRQADGHFWYGVLTISVLLKKWSRTRKKHGFLPMGLGASFFVPLCTNHTRSSPKSSKNGLGPGHKGRHCFRDKDRAGCAS